MQPAWEAIPGRAGGAALLAAHAGQEVPPGFSLPAGALESHVGHDVGTAALARALASRLEAPALLARQSRLWVDLNRAEDDPTLAPETSDGWVIAANRLDEAARAERLAAHRAAHTAAAAWLRQVGARLLVDLHSFTPRLATRPDEVRPWPLALLVNRDRRAADAAAGVWQRHPQLPGPIGWNQPYSGQELNHILVCHGEAAGRGVLALEVRQDCLADDAGVADMVELLAPGIEAALAAVA